MVSPPTQHLHKMLEKAEEQCINTEFTKADTTLRLLLAAINQENQSSDNGFPAFEEYVSEISRMYGELMPETIAIPDEIAVDVFQRQMIHALDSAQFSANDSMLLAHFLTKPDIDFSVPVVWNNRVMRALQYYVSRNKATISRWQERSSPYLSFMKKMFTDNNLPPDLAYLPLIESGFNPKAYSRACASGIWQFIPSTGRLYGLRQNYWLDERRDPVRSTNAAICYLKKLYNDFGHWHLALAAYNCGEGGLQRAINKHNTNDYWQLSRLPAETKNYVPLYLAALTLAKNPNIFTMTETNVSDTIPFDTIEVSSCIDLRDVAEGIGVAYDTIKKLNPHILHWCTPPDLNGVLLYLPSGKAPAYETFYATLPEEKKVTWYRYRIERGDNLGSIARHFKLPIESIKSVNRLKGAQIIAGKYIFIPIPITTKGYKEPVEVADKTNRSIPETAAEPTAIPVQSKKINYRVKPGDSVWRIAEIFGVDADQISGWNNLQQSRIKAGQMLSIYTSGKTNDNNVLEKPSRVPAQAHTSTIAYVVSAGDNLFNISQNFSVSVSQIQMINNLSASTLIHIGDTLYLPESSTSSVSGRHLEKTEEEVVYYEVKSGDNLWRIANNFGVPVEELFHYNALHAASILVPGDTIRVLRKGGL